MKKLRIIIYILIILATSLSQLKSPVSAHRISPAYQEINLKKGDTYNGKVSFTNTTEQSLEIIIDASPYNKNTVNTQDDFKEILINPKIEKTTVNPNETIQIPYKIEANTGLRSQTYYNALTIIESSSDGENLSLPQGLGVVFRINIYKTENDFVSNIHQNTKLDLKITKINIFKGTVETEFTLKNNTPYTIKPIGAIVLINENKDRFPTKKRFNEKEELLRSDNKLTEKYTFKIYDPTQINFSEIKKLFESYNIGTRIQITPKIQKETQIKFSIYQTYKIIFITIGTLLAILLLLILRKFVLPLLSKVIKISS